MPTPSKFTEETRTKILQALQVGASQRTAAAIAGIDAATLTRWLEKGRNAEEGSRWAEFHAAVREAEASPRLRALGVIYKEMPDRPDLAWKFLERREPGFAPQLPTQPLVAQGQIEVQLVLSSGQPLALRAADVIEGEVVELAEPDGDTGANPAAAS